MNKAFALQRSSRSARQLRQAPWICTACQRRRMTTDGRFEAGDTALLRLIGSADQDGLLLWPLKAGKELHRAEGVLKHDDIIGKRVRELVRTPQGRKYTIHQPTLDEYTRLTPRKCTPIYGADANLIVSLLDVHSSADDNYDPSASPGLQLSFAILEAGTGHGSLTLHLARAIHAMNAPLAAKPAPLATSTNEDGSDADGPPSMHRRAVIHTLDNNRDRSKHAQKIIAGFRHGLYTPDVDFHVGAIDKFLARKAEEASADPTLAVYNHIILDLPSSHVHMGAAAKLLKVDGCLLLWVPSVTQILAAMHIVRDEAAPLWLDRVVEVGPGMSGGRLWDMRWTRIRSFDRKARAKASGPDPQAAESTGEASDSTVQEPEVTEPRTSTSESAGIEDRSTASPAVNGDQGEAMICRPKVWERIIGGGFIAIWKRTRDA